MATRRKLLLMAGAAAGTIILTGGGAGAFVYFDGFEGWIRSVLRNALPGYELEPKGLAQFTRNYYEQRKDSHLLRLFAAIQRLADVRWTLNPATANEVDEEERKIVSDFLLGSDFFAHYPTRARPIVYAGITGACTSPFATF